MSHNITEWTFRNESTRSVHRLGSISNAVELLVEASGKASGEDVGFIHSNHGYIMCTCGKHESTLAFSPVYDENAHSIEGFQRASPGPAQSSSSETAEALPIMDVVRAVVFILENHDYPCFLKWQPGC